MSLITWAAPAPRLPSLVEAALASRQQEWRASDLALERAGRLHPPNRRGKPGQEKWRRIQPQAEELFMAGLSAVGIALELNTSEKVVRRALGLVGLKAKGVAEARATLAMRRDALAVRGGGRVASRRSGVRG